MADTDFTLTKEFLEKTFTYRDGLLIWRWLECSNKRLMGLEAGSWSKQDRYKKVSINKQSYKVHRLIYFMHHAVMPKYIDHINGNTFDNRIENLREATYSQNNQNASIRKDSTSKVKGVYFSKAANKWVAACQVNKKRHHLGCFATIAEAEKVLKSFREQHHGEFARHS